MEHKPYFVYLLTNPRRTVLYIGMTNDLTRRIAEHKAGRIPGFTSRYKCSILVYYEVLYTPLGAIEREKQLKAGPRKKKEELIMSVNPGWMDLSHSISV